MAKHIVIGIAIGICAIILTVVLSKFELFDTLELKSLDAKFRLRGAKTPTSDIVIVNIDDESFNELGVFPS